MNCTFIGHSAFLLESEDLMMLFDHTEGPLLLPSEEKPLVVFASHRHADHWNKSALELAKRKGKTTFVLSDDIPASEVHDGLTVKWVKPHQEVIVEGLHIQTLRSTDEGVAFIITQNEQTIYYAGDLNYWHWEGESDAYNEAMGAAYRAEMERLPSHLDIAFVPVDPRLGSFYSLGAKTLLEYTTVETLIPMHFWGDGSVCSRLEDELVEFTGQVVHLDESPYTWRIA
ncbi:MAG: MBL fold metallo-hydrolase [Sphaerochaeta sp.]